MREQPLNNFTITYSDQAGRDIARKWVRPTASLDVREELQTRLDREYLALGLASIYCPELVPEVYYDVPNPDTSSSISMERLDEAPDVSLVEVIRIVEQLQNKIPPPPMSAEQEAGLPVYSVGHYWRAMEFKLDYLVGSGFKAGISDSEATRIKQNAEPNFNAIGVFDTVFVHTDAQPRHFGRSADGKLKIFDFDQGHFGNELEDFAFLAIRKPEWAAAIKKHLENKFAGDDIKLENLDRALAFFTDYFLVKGVYDREHQARGHIFDSAAKLYGRLALQSPRFRQAAGFVLTKLNQ